MKKKIELTGKLKMQYCCDGTVLYYLDKEELVDILNSSCLDRKSNLDTVLSGVCDYGNVKITFEQE